MPTQEGERAGGEEGSPLKALVAAHVLAALGQRRSACRLQVCAVFGDNYRVNVYVGTGDNSLKVAHSFFIRANGDGKILDCCPPIPEID